MKKRIFSLYNILFFVLVLVGLSYVWGQKFFLTSDGPTHVYNSKILLDLLRGQDFDFYSQFYRFSFSFFPNWFTHASLVLLQLFLNPVLAEKVLVSVYIVVFPVSFVFAVKQFSSSISFLSLLILLWVLQFLFQHCFCFSFYRLLEKVPRRKIMATSSLLISSFTSGIPYSYFRLVYYCHSTRWHICC